MLVSGLLGGWLMSLMFQPSAVPAATTSGSSLMRWAGALSCCTRTSPGASGHELLMAGKTSSTIFLLYTSFVTSTVFVSSSPARLFLLLR